MLFYKFYVLYIFCSDFVSWRNVVLIDFDHLNITFSKNAVKGTPPNFSQRIFHVQLFFVYEEVVLFYKGNTNKACLVGQLSRSNSW